LAESLALSISGVDNVQNEITIYQPPELTPPPEEGAVPQSGGGAADFGKSAE
jgi:hypothetical protein